MSEIRVDKISPRLGTDVELNSSSKITNFSSTGIDDNATSNALTLDSSANLQFNSGYGSVATAYGCRAWVNFNGIGTVAIRASGNVSSITDNGTGDYTVNFATAMPDNDYAAIVHGVGRGADSSSNYYPGYYSNIGNHVNAQTYSTTAFRFYNKYTTTGAGVDVDTFSILVAR